MGENYECRAADEVTLIECIDNDALWGKEYGKRPVILLKDAKQKTYVVLDLEGRLCFIGDAETAKRVVEDDNCYDDEEGYKGENNKEITKKERVKFKLRCECGSYYIENINWEDSLIKAILSDNVNDLVKLSSESSFDPNKKIGSLRISPIEFMALCGSKAYFNHAISTNLYKFDNIAKYAILGGNMDIIHILEQKEISFDNMLLFTRNPDLAEWLLEHWENIGYDIVSVCKDPKRWSWALIY